MSNYSSQANDENRSLASYIRTVNEIPLIKKEEENQLASIIAQVKPENLEEDLDLFQHGEIAEKAQDAAYRLYEANLRIVVHIARRYTGHGLHFGDLIGEGNAGLKKAITKFDPSKGAKLSTYAEWWIKQYISRALSTQSRAVPIPLHMQDRLIKINRASIALSEELGRLPTDAEIGDEIGVSEHKITSLRGVTTSMVSLDGAAYDGENSATWGELIEDSHNQSPLEALTDKSAHEEVLETMQEKLDEKEIYVLTKRFGLDHEKSQTLEEVGETLNVTRERVRQIQKKGIHKLQRAFRKKRIDTIRECELDSKSISALNERFEKI